ncbi:glycan metabolism protein RagB [Tenacibaculum holothuriorum]|uniref:Glycan metabolism protein RagB n=1 Tax=Tenacibaculum holothuriorum TaxID=1635173 RepID=A0A1Y2PFB5_9FLAO|nr:RagB/SusD family nutrient uptake outer membrane protein [Tenacibaculum holothuriorum]OSY88487.1 glycan metabolism protein RagB [Tenacibaculum holothuriorum]
MTKKIIYSLSLVATMLFVGCSDDFLDVKPTQLLSDDQLGEAAQFNPAIVNGSVQGLYTLLFQTGTGNLPGARLRHYDFGQKAYDIFTDMLTGDMALSVNTYGWYRRFTELQSTVDFTQEENVLAWRYYYRLIRAANKAIAQSGGNDFTPTSQTTRHLMGQAKAVRAWLYFNLLQSYTSSYVPADPALPLHTDPAQGSQPKSTQAEVYAQVVKDLTEAIDLLQGFNRSGKNQVNQWVAKGILAYTYAAMGDNQKVKDLTSDIINNGGFTLVNRTEALGGFNDVNTAGWMWGQDITADLGLDLVSWWGQMDLFTYSYAWAGDRKAIDQTLYNAIPNDDVRKGQFFNNPGHTYHLMPFRKFYAPARTIGGQRNVTTDYIYMRVAEMYLLNAEANAKLGMDGDARTSLKALLGERLPNTNYIDALSGQALQDEIYLQTRIELWGEGKVYFSFKRNMKSSVRGSNHLSLVGEVIPSTDNRLSFEIPQGEIQNNPFISDQNK